MNSEFTIKDWSAYAPGLTQKTDWASWAADPFLPSGEAVPALSEMPPMQRRRVDALGRMALQVAWWCQQAAEQEVPLVFASRHGDLARTSEMLGSLARDEPLSPTHFGLSTHNAIAAQYSITRKLGSNYLSVSAGPAYAEAAVTEALGLLADGAEEVLVIVYDSPLPEAYAAFGDEPEAPFAWAARLGLPGSADESYRLSVDGAPDQIDCPPTRRLPHGLEVLRFLIDGQAALQFHENGRSWTWRRHA